MKLSDFDYRLPKELIAQHPLRQRDASRLLVLDRPSGLVEHRIFKDITGYFNEGDLLVLNDTKVLPSRLIGKRPSGGRAEVLLIQKREGFVFDSFIKPARVKIGETLNFDGGNLKAKVVARNQIEFNAKNIESIYANGLMPLPPYIKREPEESDNEYYQTVYASKDGAIASPTAGRHFTHELLNKISSMGVNIAYITLHVGLSTFLPVKDDEVARHKMGKEEFAISQETVDLIARTKKSKKRIFAVGTTSCRALETYAGGLREGGTDLFIYPGYKFKLVDCLLTNFHLPKTTLFMLVCAFCTEQLAKKAYQEAIDRRYRFYSYGDAMLIV